MHNIIISTRVQFNVLIEIYSFFKSGCSRLTGHRSHIFRPTQPPLSPLPRGLTRILKYTKMVLFLPVSPRRTYNILFSTHSATACSTLHIPNTADTFPTRILIFLSIYIPSNTSYIIIFFASPSGGVHGFSRVSVYLLYLSLFDFIL